MYLPSRQAQEMVHPTTILEKLGPQPPLVSMDSNLHHRMCNPSSYADTHREVDNQTSLINENGLLLDLSGVSPPSSPTTIAVVRPLLISSGYHRTSKIGLQCAKLTLTSKTHTFPTTKLSSPSFTYQKNHLAKITQTARPKWRKNYW